MTASAKKAFTLIELLVVVAIIGILSSIGVVAYNGYTKASQKKIVINNFNSTVRYMEAEISKCILDKNAKAFGLPCPVNTNDVRYQECAAVYLSLRYNIRNPLKLSGAPINWTASRNFCPTLAIGDAYMGVGSGNGEVDGVVSIVICPRSPYCASDPKTNGKFKVMWWWDGRKMQDYKIVDTN